MSKLTVAGIAVLGALAVALVLGTQWLKGDPESATVVTVIGLLGLGISQLIGNKDIAENKRQTEELSKDLKNGTFERLMRESLRKLAEEDGQPVEINEADPETHVSGTGGGDFREGGHS